MGKCDYIVVGAGLTGGIIARKLAEEKNTHVRIVERRNHIAGNIYDCTEKHGIKIQKYGPHVFHTNDESVYHFLTRYCKPMPYRTKCEAVINGVSTPSPFNFKTIDQFYTEQEAENLKNRLLNYYKKRSSVTVLELLESNDEKIKEYARFLFDNDYKLYTAKQWNLKPEEIDPSVLRRVPIVLSYGDTYFYDKYEFMPDTGFTGLYNKIICHPNIEVQLNTDALCFIEIDEKNKKLYYGGEEKKIIYTGAIDELFKYKYGVLPYRSLSFVYEYINTDSFQSTSIVAYPQVEGYTRITEYSKMPVQNCNGWTCVAYEYPVTYNKNAKVGNEPYYPVLTKNSQEIYSKYKAYADGFENLILGGRLAEFRYYNMDQVILRALEIYKSMEED